MQFYVIRHGLSEGNSLGIIQGQTDSPLTDTGREQASLLGRWFASLNIRPDKVFSSPLSRAFDTASEIIRHIDSSIEITKVDEFMEVNVGKIAGLSIEDVDRQFPDTFKKSINKWMDFREFGGENLDDLFMRVGKKVDEIIAHYDNKPGDDVVFFVVHAGATRPILRSILQNESDFMYIQFGNCSTAKIGWREIRGHTRKVLEYLIRIEQVAALMGKDAPDAEDRIIKSF